MTDKTVQMTDISFTEAHLRVIEQALEVYTRLRLGQFDNAIDEAFPDAELSWNERQNIHKFLRGIIMPEAPRLQYDGHGNHYDQYGNAYDENGIPDLNMDFEMKSFLKRAKNNSLAGGGLNCSYGIGNKKVGDGSLAYEIRQTIRQYLAVKRNDGYFEQMYVSYDDPCKVTDEPLPVIKGFTKEKIFVVEDLEINKVLNKMFKRKSDKKWAEMWRLIEVSCSKPDNIESSRKRLNFNKETKKWELILNKPTRKLKSEKTF